MQPTHVFGYGAREYRDAHGWTDAQVITGTSLNPTGGARGDTFDTRRHIRITPGEYGPDVSTYLGKHAFVTVSGDPDEWPRLKDTALKGSECQNMTVEQLELQNAPVGIAHAPKQGACELVVRKFLMHSWTTDQNGISNPGNANLPLRTIVQDGEMDGVGSPGNTKHAIYVHGRHPGSLLQVERMKLHGSRACSMVKTDAWQVIARDNELDAKSKRLATAAHSMFDIASCAQVIIARNRMKLWRASDTQGIQTAAVDFRRRREWIGSDRPAYPCMRINGTRVETWDPPRSDIAGFSPGEGWSGLPVTHLSETFWQTVASYDRYEREHPFAFDHWISDNELEGESEDGKPLRFLRDQGTLSAWALKSFGRSYLPRQVPWWIERARNWTCNNTIKGEPGAWVVYDMRFEDSRGGQSPLYLERTRPEHFPIVIEVPPTRPPEWFLQ
jgi:hypothetical protein